MRPFRSRVQTKLFILFACKNSLLRKAGEEEKKENETKSFGTTKKKSIAAKKFFKLLPSRQILSLSLSLSNEKFSRLSFFFCSLEISFLFDRSMKNLSRIVCAHHHPPKRRTRALRRSTTTTTLQRTRVHSSLLSTVVHA
jgi:hypothetical protein